MSISIKASLIGRSQECQLLVQAYQRGTRDTASSDSSMFPPSQELILIQGPSGTGKTTLANSIVPQVSNEDAGLFLSGKFEVSNFQKPYEVFFKAFEKFPETVQACDDVRRDAICHAIREAVRSEEKVLTDIIPALADLLGQQQDYDGDGDSNNDYKTVQGKDALYRFQFVFSNFVRAVSAVVPLVLFFDDLQWSDSASLRLLQVVLESKSNHQKSSLLVICAFREESLQLEQPRAPQLPSSITMPQTTVFPEFFKTFLQQMTSSTLINVTNIKLGNLDEDATCRLVNDYLGASLDVRQKLGPIIFKKCQGNPFHALQLLGPLLNHKMQHNMMSDVENGWICRDADIFELAEAVGTVDDLISQKLSLLSQLPLQVLQAAACMGDCIDYPALCTVFDGSESSVENSLKLSLSEGFLIYEPMLGQYRFTHDRFRQATLSTIDDVHDASFCIGHKLWTKSSPLFLNTKMFAVANLLNHGTNIMTDQVERYGAAAINLEAGLKAVSLAAFPDACRFLRAGADFLEGGDYWNEQYDLSLNLFSTAIDAELCNQNFDLVADLVKEVLVHARTVKDKLRAQVALINSLGQRGNVGAAIQLGVDVSKQLVEPLPPKLSNVSVLFEIVKTRIALRGRSNMTLLTLPPLQDEDRILAMYILTNLVTYTFQVASNYCPLIGARIVRLCLRYGTHKWGALGFVTFGFVMCALDRNEGYKLGTLALEMIKRYRGKELLPRVHMYFMRSSIIGSIHWKRA